MFTNVRRPPVLVYHQGCENLPDNHLVINIATWNARNVYDKTDFKLTNILNGMTRLNIDILRVTETHWINETEESFEIGKHTIIHSCRKNHIHCQGVSLC